MFDIIGDIHGHADALKALLTKLGFSADRGLYRHPDRKAIFVGDYIDRGPKIPETLKIVRNMVESDNAIALLGNHEYNAICFNYPDNNGGHLRPHLEKNIFQHSQTLDQFKRCLSVYDDFINWFITLPLFFENDDFRVVHACWDDSHINFLKTVLPDNKLTKNLIYKSAIKDSSFYTAIDETLKGKELKMPDGMYFRDHEGTKRSEIRIKWWEDPTIETYNSISIETLDNLPHEKIHLTELSNLNYYRCNEKPVFFGHYWLKGVPGLIRNNIGCVDYSVAKNGKLVAYRWDNGMNLNKSNFVYVC